MEDDGGLGVGLLGYLLTNLWDLKRKRPTAVIPSPQTTWKGKVESLASAQFAA